jgi:phosphatidylglycerol---prolipoprotein diacylglyceryl transferase
MVSMIEFFPTRQVALSIFSFTIHWYGLLYLLSFWIAYVLLPKLARYRTIHVTHDDWASILFWAVIGVLAGGRLGFVLLYEPLYFFEHPLEILAVWKGGMASHGGFAGVIGVLSYVLWQRNISVRDVADIAVIPTAIGLALGRFGNLLNNELNGIVTASGFQHPLQIYGIAQNLLIAVLCYVYLQRKPVLRGRTFALFLLLYSFGRFLLEFVREQYYSEISFGLFTLTRGQLYTVPILLFGIFLWRRWGEEHVSNEIAK